MTEHDNSIRLAALLVALVLGCSGTAPQTVDGAAGGSGNAGTSGGSGGAGAGGGGHARGGSGGGGTGGVPYSEGCVGFGPDCTGIEGGVCLDDVVTPECLPLTNSWACPPGTVVRSQCTCFGHPGSILTCVDGGVDSEAPACAGSPPAGFCVGRGSEVAQNDCYEIPYQCVGGSWSCPPGSGPRSSCTCDGGGLHCNNEGGTADASADHGLQDAPVDSGGLH